MTPADYANYLFAFERICYIINSILLENRRCGVLLSNANKEQLSEISAYISSEFGVVDDSGHVLYIKEAPDGSENTESVMTSVFSELQSDDSANIYADSAKFERAGYMFENVTAGSDDPMFMFVKINDSGAEAEQRMSGMLSLAAHGFRYREMQSGRDLINIFKKLLIDGRRSVTEEQVESVYAEYKILSSGFAVVLVSLNKSAGSVSADSDMICRILQEIFGREAGSLVIPIDYARTAVVCPLRSDTDFEYVRDCAYTVKDTLLSEAMADAGVALSSSISEIMNLNDAYLEADRAKNIGAIFELPDKCFEYSKLGLEKLIYSIPLNACVGYVNELLGEGFIQDRSAQELLNTVKVFLDNNLNVSEASRVLYIHRNTLMYRLDKFNKMTGLDCTGFDTGMKIGIALLILKFIENKEPSLLGKM